MSDTPVVQIQAPTSGFVLGRSLIGSALASAADSIEWIDYLDPATGYRIVRGGQPSPLAGQDVGTLSFALHSSAQSAEALDGHLALRPGRSVRVIRHYEADAATAWDLVDDYLPYTEPAGDEPFGISFVSQGTGWRTTGSTLAVDLTADGPGLALITNAHPDDGAEHRIQISFRSSEPLETVSVAVAGGQADQYTISHPGTWSGNLYQAQVDAAAGEWIDLTVSGPVARNTGVTLRIPADPDEASTIEIRAWEHERTGPAISTLFTGRLDDVDTTYHHDTETITVIAADPVSILANTTAPATSTPSTGPQPFAAAVSELLDASSVPSRYMLGPATARTVTADWTPIEPRGALQYITSGVRLAARWPGGTLQNRVGFTQQIDGLTPGHWYIAEAFVRDAGPVPGNQGLYLSIADYPDWGGPLAHAPGRLGWWFMAEETSHTLVLERDLILPTSPPASQTLFDLSVDPTRIELWQLGFMAQDDVREGDIASKMNSISASTGGLWWAGKDGIVRYQLGLPSTSKAILSDDDTGDASYTEIKITRSGRDLINDLTIDNVGRDAEGNSVTETHNFKNPTSIASWGSRASQVEMRLHPQPYGPGTRLSIPARAAEIMTARAAPVGAPRKVGFIGHDNPALAASLEIHDIITVRHRGDEYRCRIAGIEHDITPSPRGESRWKILLHLDPLETKEN